jgi:hypothetical protein
MEAQWREGPCSTNGFGECRLRQLGAEQLEWDSHEKEVK